MKRLFRIAASTCALHPIPIRSARLPRSLCKPLSGAFLTLALLGTAAPARAASDQPIRMIVPLAVGSTVDAIARALGPGISRATGQTVVVENLAGAGGIPGTARLVNAPADGLTLGMISSNHVIAPGIYPNMPYDSLHDITPVMVLATVPLVLVVNPKLPVDSVQSLRAYAHAHPGRLNVGSAGNGSTLHLAAELLIHETGIDIRHIPYRGTAQLITDLIGGQVDLGFVSISQAASHVKSGALRVLAVSTPMRSTALPDVPTMDEAGVTGYRFDAWVAMIAPAKLPQDLALRSADAVRSAMRSSEARALFVGQGLMPMDIGPQQAPAFFASELEKHQRLIRQSSAKMD